MQLINLNRNLLRNSFTLYSALMSRRDKIHDNVRTVLLEDGWIITHDPYVIALRDEHEKTSRYSVDLGAEKLIAAEKDAYKIAVEVKTLGGSSLISEYHHALGQYLDYLVGLEVQEPARKLFLAITEASYQALMESPLAKLSLTRYPVNLLVFDEKTNRIVQWKE